MNAPEGIGEIRKIKGGKTILTLKSLSSPGF
jgi:hypothetical protein